MLLFRSIFHLYIIYVVLNLICSYTRRVTSHSCTSIRPQMCKLDASAYVDEGGSSNVRAVRAGGWRASYLNEEEFG